MRSLLRGALIAVVVAAPAPATAQSAAARLYQQACDRGDAEACYLLGRIYETGTGVAEDASRAQRLYQRACEAGSDEACGRLPDRSGRDVVVETGVVTDAETGEPLGEALVEVPELQIQAISDATGWVELPPMRAGRYGVSIQRAGYGVVRGDMEVPGTRDFMVALSPSPMDDPTAPGLIRGRVLDDGIPTGVDAVDVSLVGRPSARAITDSQGRFSLTGVAPGLVELQLERLGYTPRTTYLVVHPGGMVEIDATMSTHPIQLDPIEVTVQSEYLRRRGFFRRQRQLPGHTFTRDELDELPLFAAGDVLNFVPGMRVERGIYGAVLRGRRGCQLLPYLDGVEMEDFDVDIVSPDWLEGVEVHMEPFIPPEFWLRIENSAYCGIVLLWTRR